MTRWYSLDLADADFLASAPHIFRYQKRFAAPPERVWESLASDESVAAWGRSVTEVRWTAPRPFVVGATREVALAGGVIRMHERFFRWDEGSGYSFGGYEATVPGLRRFAEDYRVQPDGDGTLFDWTVAMEPIPALALPFKVISPGVKAAFGRLATDGQRYFAKR
jgi:hypothetical protein